MKKIPLPALSLMSLIVLFLTHSACRAGFGISPPSVENDHLQPGESYEQTINLARNNPENEQIVYDLRVTGDRPLPNWVVIPKISDFILPKGQKLTPMEVMIKVPDDAISQEYKGHINFLIKNTTVSTPLGGGQVAIGYGGDIFIDITVLGNNKAAPAKAPALPATAKKTSPKMAEKPAAAQPAAAQATESNAENKTAETTKLAVKRQPIAVVVDTSTETVDLYQSIGWIVVIVGVAGLAAAAGLKLVRRKSTKDSPSSPAPLQ